MILANSFKSKMAAKKVDFDRFCNDSGSDCIQSYNCHKMTEHYKLIICIRLIW